MAQRHHGGRGRIGVTLEAELSAIQKQNPTRSPRWCWQQVFERSGRYGDMDFETFYKRVNE